MFTDSMKGNHLSIREIEHSAESARIFIRTAGALDADDVLIMIHGGPGLSHRYMLGLEQLASPQLTVVNYDQRGTGRSPILELQGAEAQVAHFAPTTYAQDLESVRSVVAQGKKVHILGHSWGGMVAMYYAIQYPEHVRSLLLIDSVPPTVAGLHAGFEHFEARLKDLQQQGIVPTELSTDHLERLKQILPVYVSRTNPSFDLPRFTETIDHTPEVGEQTWKALGDFDLSAQVAALKLPLHIFYGEDDPFGRVWADETRAAFSNATIDFQMIPDCGHFGWLECPEIFFPALQNFIEQHKVNG
ncbi:alpha/beta fold hydrolase [Ktedonospora formicarum]|uniref:Amino acid amidase n=1 Tax=Ktedonospora formicarum TaxID=2778364 RepID=A0A8J3HQT8_9CHLR|nr:alpha/beta hydrolase [Ktedonospora formicarum]GHO42122.1 amino acid amidase [Ktedonospora formicarum]